MVGQPQPQRLGRRCADQREVGSSQALRIARRRLARGLRLGGRNHSEQGAVIFFRRPGQERLDGRNDRGPIVKRLELFDGDLADDPPRRRRAVGGQRGDGGLREFRVGGEWASCPVGVPSVGRRFQQPAEHLGGGLLVPSAFAEAIDGGGQAGIVLPLRAVVIVAFPIGQIAGMGRLSRFAALGMPSASVSEDGLAGGTGLAGGIPAGRPGRWRYRFAAPVLRFRAVVIPNPLRFARFVHRHRRRFFCNRSATAAGEAENESRQDDHAQAEHYQPRVVAPIQSTASE